MFIFGFFAKWYFIVFLFVAILDSSFVFSQDAEEVIERGVLRHLGVAYSNFITGSGDGFSVELMQLFADYLDVRYEFIETDWKNIVSDLSGKKILTNGNIVDVPIKGDVISNGFTKLPSRQKFLNYSSPSFITQVWLIVRADSTLKPIVPTEILEDDIQNVKLQLKNKTVLCVSGTSLDAKLYGFDTLGAFSVEFDGNINDLVPAVMNGEADACLLDVPDALVALDKWASQIKVIGPVSKRQLMCECFRFQSPELLCMYNDFLNECKKDGTYMYLVKKYYPLVIEYFDDFF